MQVWPQGAWFGLTRRRLLCISAGISLLLLAFVAWFSYCRYEANQARSLLADIRTLKIGESTFAGTQHLRNRYPKDWRNWREPEKKCTPEDCDYTMAIDDIPFTSMLSENQILNQLIAVAGDTETLNNLGCQRWMVIVGFVIQKDRVVSTSGNVLVETPGHYWLGAGWEYSNTIPDWQLKSIAGINYHGYNPGKYLIRWPNLDMGGELGKGVDWTVTTAASAREIQDAFDINTKCLTTIGGCFKLGDLKPVVTTYMPGFDR